MHIQRVSNSADVTSETHLLSWVCNVGHMSSESEGGVSDLNLHCLLHLHLFLWRILNNNKRPKTGNKFNSKKVARIVTVRYTQDSAAINYAENDYIISLFMMQETEISILP